MVGLPGATVVGMQGANGRRAVTELVHVALGLMVTVCFYSEALGSIGGIM